MMSLSGYFINLTSPHFLPTPPPPLLSPLPPSIHLTPCTPLSHLVLLLLLYSTSPLLLSPDPYCSINLPGRRSISAPRLLFFPSFSPRLQFRILFSWFSISFASLLLSTSITVLLPALFQLFSKHPFVLCFLWVLFPLLYPYSVFNVNNAWLWMYLYLTPVGMNYGLKDMACIQM